MKVSLFSFRGRNHLLKTLHNVRVTLLCGLLTFIVLRSSLGAGRFGTPVQDYDDIQHQLHRFKLRRQQKLVLRRELSEPTLLLDKSRSTISVSTEESHADNAMHGHAFYNRAGFLEWFELKHLPRVPRILLVTKRSRSCNSAIAAQFLPGFLQNKIDYCILHGIEIFYDAEAADASATAGVLRELMLSHPDVEWLWWMDSFTIFTDMSPPVLALYAGYNVVCGVGSALSSNHNLLSTWEKMWSGGSFMLRNCQWSRSYLRNEGQVQVAAEFFQDAKMGMYEPGVRNGQAHLPFVMHFGSCDGFGEDNIDSGCLASMERAVHAADRRKTQAGSL